MRLESKKYVYDIAHAAELALQFVEGKSFSDYVSDPLLRSAVERQLQTAGEALTQLSKTDAASASRISEQSRIIAFRNILVHGYADIDDPIVWNVLGQKLPVLLREAKALLAEA